MEDNPKYNIFSTPISDSKIPQKIFSSRTNLSTEVLPKKQQNFEEKPDFGYCQFYLLPERHLNMKMISSTNDNSYKDVRVSFDIYDPASRFPQPTEIQEIQRPKTVHKRPAGQIKNYFNNDKDNKNEIKIKIQNSINTSASNPNDNLSKIFPEDSKILAIEKPTIKILRWILSCPRFSPVSLKLINFIQSFHKTTIHGYSHIINPCFKNCVRKSPDLITGFHFLSPKEEVFVLETREIGPSQASLSLELFLRNEVPSETHIIGNKSISFPAPRLYCCTDDLIQKVENPICLNELLQVDGLYFRQNENHKLFSIAQKLANIIQSRRETEIIDSYPNYAEIKLLEKRAKGLYAIPITKSLTITPINQAKGADFGDSNNDKENTNNYFENLNYQRQQNRNQDKIKENKERLTTFYLAKPISSSSKQRNESLPMQSRKKKIEEDIHQDSISINIKPPENQSMLSKKAPRTISTNKQLL